MVCQMRMIDNAEKRLEFELKIDLTALQNRITQVKFERTFWNSLKDSSSINEIDKAMDKSKWLMLVKQLLKNCILIIRCIILLVKSYLSGAKNSNLQKKNISIVKNLSRQHTITLPELDSFFASSQIRLKDIDTFLVLESHFVKKDSTFRATTILSSNLFLTLYKTLLNNKEKLLIIKKLILLIPSCLLLFLKNRITIFHLTNIPESLLFVLFSNKNHNCRIIETISNTMNEPLIFFKNKECKNIKTIMLHYSENAVMYTENQLFINDMQRQFYNNICVDEHWCWTQEFADFFETSIGGKFIPKGPILFRPVVERNIGTEFNSDKILELVFFDDPPTEHTEFVEQSNRESGLAVLNTIQKLYELGQNQGIKLNILYKRKRRVMPFHEPDYQNLLNSMLKLKIMTDVGHDIDQCRLVAGSDFIVCALGTSPALLGRYLSVPTCYVYSGRAKIEKAIDYKLPIFFDAFEIIKWISSQIK